MHIKYYAKTYLATFIAFAALDAAWITQVAAPLYKSALGPLMLDQGRPVVAVVFYLLQIGGMMVFVTPRPGAPERLARTALFGALYGFFTYTTFDLTNYAILRPWTLFLASSDIAWGTILSAAASAIGVGIGRWWSRGESNP